MSIWDRVEAWLERDAAMPTFMGVAVLIVLSAFLGFLLTR